MVDEWLECRHLAPPALHAGVNLCILTGLVAQLLVVLLELRQHILHALEGPGVVEITHRLDRVSLVHALSANFNVEIALRRRRSLQIAVIQLSQLRVDHIFATLAWFVDIDAL